MCDEDRDEQVDAAVSKLIDLVDAQAEELRPATSSRSVVTPDFTHLLREDLRRILSGQLIGNSE